MADKLVQLQDYNNNNLFPRTKSELVSVEPNKNLKNVLIEILNTLNSKVGFGNNNAANPRITLFDKCGLDATERNNAGQGTAIRVKWDDENYILVSDVDVRVFLKGLNALIIKKDHGANSNPIEIRDTNNSGTYHNMFSNGKVSLKFLSTSAMMQVRDGTDTNYGDLRVKELYYMNLAGSSDKNLKENIKYIKTNDSISQREISGIDLGNDISDITELDMYNLINKIDLYNFDYIGAENSNTIGFMAQHIQNDKIGKKLVKEDIDGNLCFNLYSYISCLTGAFKEEVRKREALEDRLEKIVNGIENLKN